MASFLFQNTKTGETKVINSANSATAKRVYSNKTWIYLKAVPKQTTPKKSTNKQILELQTLSRQLASEVIRLRSEAMDYDCRFAQLSASRMEDILSVMQRKLNMF